jgi:hypothetical protein
MGPQRAHCVDAISFPASLLLPNLTVNVLAPVSPFEYCSIVDISACR